MRKVGIFGIIICLLWLAGCEQQSEKFKRFMAQKTGQSPQTRLDPLAADFSMDDEAELKSPAKKTASKTARRTAKTASASHEAPIKAMLFLSDTCPWCRKLKRSGFVERFRRKYRGDIELSEYEVSSQENMRLYSKMVRKYKLSGGVPLLIIGNTPIQGYSDDMMKLADDAAFQEFRRHNRMTAQAEAAAMPAILDITMDDETLSGVAPEADLQRMRSRLHRMQENNGALIASMEEMFGPAVRNKTMAVVNQTEQQLKQAARSAKTYSEFEQTATRLEAAQQTQVDELVRQNLSRLKSSR